MSDRSPENTSILSFAELADYPVDELELRRGYDRIKSLMEIFITIDQRERQRNENIGNQHYPNQTK